MLKRSIGSIALMAIGAALIWAYEPDMHAWTAYALGCGLFAIAGGAMFGVGLCMLAMNDATERAGRRIFRL